MPSKYTIKKVKDIFIKQGCELLSENYKVAHDKLDYKCSCGNISTIRLSSFLKGCRCKECGNKKKGNNVKYSHEQVKKLFKEQNCELLSVEYNNARDLLDYKCSCGHISKTRLSHFLKGSRCKYCGSEKTKKILRWKYEDVKNEFEKKGCKLLSKDYKNGHSSLLYECVCGKISTITLSHFLSGRRCKDCGIKKISGENSSNYNASLTYEDRENRRKIPENEIWRKKIFQKNNFTCQKCFAKGGKLNAHHIKNYSTNKVLRFEENNGITFCQSCHKNFHKKYGNKNNTNEQLSEFIGSTIHI